MEEPVTDLRELARRGRLRRLRILLHRVQAEIEQLEHLAPVRPLPSQTTSPKKIRAWARDHGIPVGQRGQLRQHVLDAYDDAHAHLIP